MEAVDGGEVRTTRKTPAGPPARLTLEARAALALCRLRGVGPLTFRRLIETHGSASAAIGRDHRACCAFLRASVVASVRAARPVRAEEVDLSPGDRVLCLGQAGYPASLTHLYDPPPILFLRGPLDLSEERIIAIVGTRRATPYGRRIAARLAAELALQGWTIVSGLARGIDAAAHRGALEAGGRTIGVLGHGLGRIYPASSRELFRALASRGLLVSEHDAGVSPQAPFFPRRNRIIAALARGVVVVQAGEKSGALITADHALDLGREVVAVPGPVDVAASAGVHGLLRDGAAPVCEAADVLMALGEWVSIGEGEEGGEGSPAAVRPGGVWVLRALESGPMSLDELAVAWPAGTGDLLAALGRLEVEGRVRTLPGNRFRLEEGA